MKRLKRVGLVQKITLLTLIHSDEFISISLLGMQGSGWPQHVIDPPFKERPQNPVKIGEKLFELRTPHFSNIYMNIIYIFLTTIVAFTQTAEQRGLASEL